MICKTGLEYIKAAQYMLHSPTQYRKIYIATYGISWGNEKYSSVLALFDNLNLEAHNGTRISVLVKCASQRHYDNLQMLRKRCNRIKFYECEDIHAKYILFDKPYLLIGSANLTESGHYDCVYGSKIDELTYQQIVKTHKTYENTYEGYDSRSFANMVDNISVG